MPDIINVLRCLPNFFHLTGASESNIASAEAALGVTFSDEYREYVFVFGAASANGHELTGVCTPTRLNVLEVTTVERDRFSNVPTDWYVVEQANIDGIVIWQAQTGEIYQTTPGATAHKLCASLSEFVLGKYC